MSDQKEKYLEAKREPSPWLAEAVCHKHHRACLKMLRLAETGRLEDIKWYLRDLAAFNGDQLTIHESIERDFRTSCKRARALRGWPISWMMNETTKPQRIAYRIQKQNERLTLQPVARLVTRSESLNRNQSN
jgi:hypothetical protein